MTDRHSGYLITLDHDIRDDDAEAIINALTMIEGVLSVQPIIGEGFSVEQRRESVKWQEMLLRVIRLAGDAGPDSVAREGKP